MQVFVLFALCLAAVAALPVQQSTRAVDWAAVNAKVEEIRGLTKESLEAVKKTASDDNEQVGASISEQIDAAAVQALQILATAQAEIDAEMMTSASAEAYLMELETLLLKTQADLKPLVDQLSATAAEAIRAIFGDAYMEAQMKAQELYALLDSKKQVRAVDWAAVNAKVEEIRGLTKESLEAVKKTASDDNEQVGASISEQIDAAAVQALQILATAQAEIDAEMLTSASAEAYLKELETLLLKTQADLKPLVDQLSATAAEAIRAIFGDAYMEAQMKAQELYALLDSKKQVRAVDWAAVNAKVAEIQGLTHSSLEQVRKAANDDNEQIGASISEQIDVAAAQALQILAAAQAEIDAETATSASAEAYLKELEALLLKTQADLKPLVDQLSASAAEAIRAVFSEAYFEAQMKAQELYALLDA